MKKIIFITTVILLCLIKSNAQTKIPKNISDEFAYFFNENYRYGNGNMGIYLREKLRMKGYGPMEVSVLVESIATNSKNRNLILEAFHDLSREENGEYLYATLYSLGISATSSKYLTEYIIEEKYKSVNNVEKKVENPKNKSSNDFLSSISNSISNKKEALSATTKNKYFEYLYNLNNYSPKISNVCEDQGYSDCFRDATAIVKELAKIRKEHLNNRDNGDYLKFYETKKAIIENRSWEKDASNIDNYIVEIIERYNDALKECGYDDFDWFKKLPKDLYQYFDLNKTELLKNIK